MSDAANITHDLGAPLAGRSVVITRTLEQSRKLAELLEALGAEVLAMPVLEVTDPPDPGAVDAVIAQLATYDWLVLTSTNAVDRFFARLVFTDRSGEALTTAKSPPPRYAAIGAGLIRRSRR